MSKKPWEVIQPSPSPALQAASPVPSAPLTAISSISNPPPTATTSTTAAATTNPSSSLLSSASSPYYSSGGFSSMGYGLGSSLGLGMGMGLGMYGLNLPQDSFMYRSLRTIESASMAVGSLSQVTRSLESNADGMSRLWESSLALTAGVLSGTAKIGRKGWKFSKKILKWVLVLLRIKKKEELGLEEEEEDLDCPAEERELRKLRKREKIWGVIVRILFLIFMGMFLWANSRTRHKRSTDVESKFARHFVS